MLSKGVQFNLDVKIDRSSQTFKLSAFSFPGSLPLPGVPGCPLYKPASSQCSPQLSRSSSLFSGPSRRTASKVPYLATQRGVSMPASLTECSCCCCNEDLMKLQVSCLYLSQLSFPWTSICPTVFWWLFLCFENVGLSFRQELEKIRCMQDCRVLKR